MRLMFIYTPASTHFILISATFRSNLLRSSTSKAKFLQLVSLASAQNLDDPPNPQRKTHL